MRNNTLEYSASRKNVRIYFCLLIIRDWIHKEATSRAKTLYYQTLDLDPGFLSLIQLSLCYSQKLAKNLIMKEKQKALVSSM